MYEILGNLKTIFDKVTIPTFLVNGFHTWWENNYGCTVSRPLTLYYFISTIRMSSYNTLKCTSTKKCNVSLRSFLSERWHRTPYQLLLAPPWKKEKQFRQKVVKVQTAWWSCQRERRFTVQKSSPSPPCEMRRSSRFPICWPSGHKLDPLSTWLLSPLLITGKAKLYLFSLVSVQS